MLFSVLNLLISSSVSRTVARTKRNSIFLGLALVLILTAYAFGLVAAAIWLATIYGAAGAALFIAAGALLLGIIVLVVMTIINTQEERRARERRLALESAASAAIGLIRAQPLLTAAVAAAFLFNNIVGTKKNPD